MQCKTLMLTGQQIPKELREIDDPPQRLFCRGASLAELLKKPRVAIVGSRRPTAYGRQVTAQLARELAEQGVVVISGLALGVDAVAHQAAVEAGGLAIAVLPGSVDKIYPRTNHRLSEEILATGGSLVSEYGAGDISYKYKFIARNRLVSGLAQAVLITEAAINSGSRHTADYAAAQGKTLLAVPGNITSKLSAGPNHHIQTGAIPVTDCRDILQAIGLTPHKTPARQVRGRNPQEQTVLDLMLTGVIDGDQLLEKSGLETSQFNQTLTMLEIDGQIRALGLNQWSIR